MEFFSNSDIIEDLAKIFGGAYSKDKNGWHSLEEILPLIKEGKEYYLATGKHASIVKKVKGVLKYLELQSPASYENGFFELTKNVFKERFGVVRSHVKKGLIYIQESYLIDIAEFKDSYEFRKLLGYLNTAEAKQNKGSEGEMK